MPTLLGLGLLLALPGPSVAQWWSRKDTTQSERYGLRFLHPETSMPVDVPVAHVAAGERHLLRVALYAVQNGQIDPAAPLTSGPLGRVRVHCQSDDPTVARIEPGDSYIASGFEGTFAQFWLVGLAPGETKITATARLGARAHASSWFGPVTITPARVATPKRLPQKKKRARRPTPEREVAAPKATSPDAGAPAPAPAPVDQTPRGSAEVAAGDEPLSPATGSTVNPMATAAPITLGPAVAPPQTSAVSSEPATSTESEPAPPAAEPDANASVAPEQKPESPPAAPPLNETLLPGRIFVSDLPGAPQEATPAGATPAPRVTPDPSPSQSTEPCRHITRLHVRNVSDETFQVRVRDAGAGGSSSRTLPAGAEYAINPAGGETLWISAQRSDGERRSARFIAAILDASAVARVPPFGDPWIELTFTVADCADASPEPTDS